MSQLQPKRVRMQAEPASRGAVCTPLISHSLWTPCPSLSVKSALRTPRLFRCMMDSASLLASSTVEPIIRAVVSAFLRSLFFLAVVFSLSLVFIIYMSDFLWLFFWYPRSFSFSVFLCALRPGVTSRTTKPAFAVSVISLVCKCFCRFSFFSTSICPNAPIFQGIFFWAKVPPECFVYTFQVESSQPCPNTPEY